MLTGYVFDIYFTKPIGKVRKGVFMRISTRARYGLRFLIELARHPGEVLSLKYIAENQKIPRRYLEQIASRLHSEKFVRSYRGPDGGYTLALPPEEVNLLDILEALGDSPVIIACIDAKGICDFSSKCAARKAWKEMRDCIAKHLRSITLADIVNQGGNETD